MKIRFSTLSLLSGILLVISTKKISAASIPKGQIIVRIEDEANAHCINARKDRITLNMRRIIVEKYGNFFSEDKEAALIVNTTISGEERDGRPKKVTFPRAYVAKVANYQDGFVSLPIEEKLFSSFSLSNSGNSYDTAEIDFAIAVKKDKKPFGIALTALLEISKSMAAPLNPFAEEFKLFSDYASKVVNTSLSEDNSLEIATKDGKVTLSFSPTGICSGDHEKTGTFAVIRGATGLEEKGIIDIGKEYCWSAQLKPVFSLKFSNRKADKTCPEASAGGYISVNNPHIAFYLNALDLNQKASSLKDKKVIIKAPKTTTLNISNHELYNAITSKYVRTGNLSTKEYANIHSFSTKVANALTKENYIPEIVESNFSIYGSEISVQATPSDSMALDVIESLQRCAAHGISVSNCW